MVDEVTLLRLSPLGVPPYSARGITQTLEPIAASSSMRRTVNGELIDLSVEELRKYKSTIQCTDQRHPALSGVWPGMTLTVSCVAELGYEETTDAAPERTVVDDSSYTEEGFTYYRPMLSMKVVGYQVNHDEWGVVVGWTMELEEV